MNLRDVQVGQTCKVLKVNGTGPVRRRIMDMGITKGQEIFVRKVAPLGDPVEVKVRNYELSVRKADCEMVEVELTGEDAELEAELEAETPAETVEEEA